MTTSFATEGTSGVAIELCCGLGGIGVAIRALGYFVGRAYDSWEEAVAVYNHNFSDDVAVKCNLLSSGGSRLVAADRRRLGQIDLVIAGPPCKGFSQIRNGHHDGRNGHNRVLAAIPDYLCILKPRFFLIENVPDLLTYRKGKTLRDLVARLERPGKHLRYTIEYAVYDAALYGTPQARRRVLIFGARHSRSPKHLLPEPGPNLAALFAAVRHGHPVPEHLKPYFAALRDPENPTLISARQALSDLPALGPGRSENETPYASAPQNAFQRWIRSHAPTTLQNVRTPAVKQETLDRLAHIPPGGCARFIPKEHLNGLSRRFGSAYRRLHPDAPSTALSTKYDCVYHYDEPRSLSVREYARLQGIPDRISFPPSLVSRRSAYEMIGNSVPPLLIERVLGIALNIAPPGF